MENEVKKVAFEYFTYQLLPVTSQPNLFEQGINSVDELYSARDKK